MQDKDIQTIWKEAVEAKRVAMVREEASKYIVIQFLLFGFLLFVWMFPVFNPIKLLVVIVHELSHIAAAYATGGQVFGMAIAPSGAGTTVGMGGNLLIIAAAGYLGSLLIGGLLYYLSAVWQPTEVWLVLTMICCCSLVFRWFNEFTQTFTIGTLVVLFVGLLVLRPWLKKLLLKLVATTSCLYPIIDVIQEAMMSAEIQGIRYAGQPVQSDVARLTDLSGIPMPYIALGWMVFSVATVSCLIYWTAQIDARVAVKKAFIIRDAIRHPEQKGHLVEKNLVYHDEGIYTSEYRMK